MKIRNKTTKAIFNMKSLDANEILKKFHNNFDIVEASEEEKKNIEDVNKDPIEDKILGGDNGKAEKSLAQMNKAELTAKASSLGLDIVEGMTNKQIVVLIESKLG